MIDGRDGWRLACFHAALIFGFYAVAAGGLFPALAKGLLPINPSFEKLTVAAGPLIVWFAVSYCAIAVALAMGFYAAHQLQRLDRPANRVGLTVFGSAAATSLVLLWILDNAAFAALGPDVSMIDGLDRKILGNRTLAWLIDQTKTLLNAVLQVAGIGLLLAFLLHASGPAADHDPRSGLRLFQAAAVLLTLVVLTDALFFDFVAAVYPPESPIISFQRGTMIFFGILSSATLGLALAAASHLGLPFRRLVPAAKSDDERNGILSEMGALAGTFVGRTGATMMPLIVALASSILESST